MLQAKKKTRKILKRVNMKLVSRLVLIFLLIMVVMITSVLFALHYTTQARFSNARMMTNILKNQLTTALDGSYEMLETIATSGLKAKESLETNGMLSSITIEPLKDVDRRLNRISVGEGRFLLYGDGVIYLAVRQDSRFLVMGNVEDGRIEELMDSALGGGYTYVLFDRSTGKIIINNTVFKSENYFDGLVELNDTRAVSELLNNEIVQFEMKLGDGREYILAQRIDNALGLLLMVPRELVGNIGSSDFVAMMPGLAGMVLLLIGFIVFACIFVKDNLYTRKMADQGIDEWRRAAETIALRSNAALFELISKGEKTDDILYFFNSLQIQTDAEIRPEVYSLSELEEYLNVDDTETGKLSSGIAYMKDGDVVDIELRCVQSTGIRSFRVELHRTESGDGRVFGFIYDCSEDEQLRRNEISESEFIEEMTPRSELIWHVNVVRNTWKLLYLRRNAAKELFGEPGVKKYFYDEDLATYLRRHFHPDDEEAAMSAFTSEGLRKSFESGKTELSMDFRIDTDGSGIWRWNRFVVRIWRDANNRDIKADIVAINVNEQKKAEIERRERADVLNRSLTALNGMYFGLFYIDLIADRCYSAKAFRGATDNVFCTSFRSLIDELIRDFVHPEDREACEKILDPWYIRKTMVENTHLMQLNYRSRMGDAYYWSTLSIQAAQFENGSVIKVVLALQHTHSADTSRNIADN